MRPPPRASYNRLGQYRGKEKAPQILEDLRGLFDSHLPCEGRFYMSIPPMPPMPPPGAPCACSSSFGDSAIMTSVVSNRPATEAAFCRARRVTLVGSKMPISTISPYSSVAAL